VSKNINEMSDIELKATVYDLMATAENSQRTIQIINDELIRRSKAPKVVKPDETKIEPETKAV